ncbi:MAG: PfkB family carbohydrate kinase [Chloroflexota bacterium]
MSSDDTFDIAFIGHYTKDTVVTPQETRIIQGGAFNYGCHVAARMGLRAAVVTRLAREDFDVVETLTRMGVRVFATPTQESTCLKLVYASEDLDQRTIYTVGFAGPFTPEEVEPVQAQAYHIGASIRGEVPLEVIQALARKKARVSLDVQGFVRINDHGKLIFHAWPQKAEVLQYVDVLKADAVEAEMLTGSTDRREAARALAELGPSEVVLTHGQGVLVYAWGRFHEASFFPAQIKGRTGRGDTCIAAYLGKRLSASPAQATVWTAALTSLKLEAPGPFRRDIADVEHLIRDRYSSSVA